MKKTSKPPFDIHNSVVNHEARRVEAILSGADRGERSGYSGPVETRKMTREERIKYGLDKE